MAPVPDPGKVTQFPMRENVVLKHISIYIYIYRERERERERDITYKNIMETKVSKNRSYIYIHTTFLLSSYVLHLCVCVCVCVCV